MNPINALKNMENRDKRDYLLLHRIPEVGPVVNENCEQRCVKVVNEVLSEHLEVTDLVRAHRTNRSIIAHVIRSADKQSILQTRREQKEIAMSVSSDLIQRQRQELDQARKGGFWAYLKGSVLHSKAQRPRPSDRDSQPMTHSCTQFSSSTEHTS